VDPYGKRELLAFYNRHLEHFGDSPQAVRWTTEGQRRRYEVLLEVAGDLTGKEVLDFGCGKADLLGFMKEHGLAVRYCGLDVNGSLLELARSKHPEASFHCLDVEEEEFQQNFDVILICGVFNLRIAGIAKSLFNSLRLLFPLCREALHLNIPSARRPRRDNDLFCADPGELLDFAERELSKYAILREGLVEGDLFLSLYRS
jgi:SAM-dependent methyltransferase